MGSKVILGKLMVIPVEDFAASTSTLLYIRAENGQLPELQRVIASYGNQVVMGETLSSTLAFSWFTARRVARRRYWLSRRFLRKRPSALVR